MIEIYTDGSCRYGTGKWAWYRLDTNELKTGKLTEHTTNNRMEMMAAIQGLIALPNGCNVKVVTDSTYVIHVSNYTPARLKNKTTLNRDLALCLVEAVQLHSSVTFEWVKGHSGNKYNEIVDLACRVKKTDVGTSEVERKAKRKVDGISSRRQRLPKPDGYWNPMYKGSDTYTRNPGLKHEFIPPEPPTKAFRNTNPESKFRPLFESDINRQ